MTLELCGWDRTWPRPGYIASRPHLHFKDQVSAIGTSGTPQAQDEDLRMAYC
jgi:hypothetical protein